MIASYNLCVSLILNRKSMDRKHCRSIGFLSSVWERGYPVTLARVAISSGVFGNSSPRGCLC